MSNEMPTSQKTFNEATVDTKLNLLFDLVRSIHEFQRIQVTMNNDRFKILEGKKYSNTMYSAVMGFIGGFAAVTAKMLFWKP
jgi:hypothetical protein